MLERSEGGLLDFNQRKKASYGCSHDEGLMAKGNHECGRQSLRVS